jgi:hypothetical protein
MRYPFPRHLAIGVALFGIVSVAAAQNQAQPEPANPQPAAGNETKKDPVPPATDKSEATRAGTQEPSAKVQGTSKDENASFDKGTLVAPGAPNDVDTAPAKWSARTAGDDALPIAAYALRHLTEDQKRAITLSVSRAKRAETVQSDFAIVGAEVPTAVALNGMQPLSESVVASIPELRVVMYTTVGDKLVLINPRTRVVIGVLAL